VGQWLNGAAFKVRIPGWEWAGFFEIKNLVHPVLTAVPAAAVARCRLAEEFFGGRTHCHRRELHTSACSDLALEFVSK
jgi:hypothetical protein